MLSLLVLACIRTRGYYVKKYEPLLAEKQQIIDGVTRYAYVTTAEVFPGELFTEENTVFRQILTEEDSGLLADDVIGKVAVARLSEGMLLHTNQCSSKNCDKTERECIFTDIAAADGFPEHELVDVRLRYPNGENYCVLKKKRLYKAGEEEEVSRLWLSEAEQVLISAARYDAFLYSGAELYFVAFIEEALQTETDSFYVPPEQSIRQLIEIGDSRVAADGTWFQMRKAVEERQQLEWERRNGY